MKKLIGSVVVLLVSASFALAATNVEINTPGATVRVGAPPPPPQVIVVDPGRPAGKEYKHDNGKHKGHKKHKKNKKERHEERGEHGNGKHHK
ncbi:MAG: hypothetical protein HXX17_02780 [Geobacteraceae bacterium]|nr:hypothetical protein [Geobacteraceae bacterium]